MFNILVTSQTLTAPRGRCTLGSDRVFGHTEPEISERFKPNGVLDQQAVTSLPTIFTNESSNDTANPTVARIGTIVRIRPGATSFDIEYALDLDVPPIPNSVLESLATELDFVMTTRYFPEFHTNHWAIKDVDLFQILFKHGIGRGARPTIFQLPDDPVDPSLVAVMMPFGARFDAVYAALQNAIIAAGMRPQRADDIWLHDHVIQDVVSLIGTAAVVICDLTDRNPNVFYEMGIAHTLGRDVIMVTQSNDHVPFDVRHIRHIQYLCNAQGLATLGNEVVERLTTLNTRRVR